MNITPIKKSNDFNKNREINKGLIAAKKSVIIELYTMKDLTID